MYLFRYLRTNQNILFLLNEIKKHDANTTIQLTDEVAYSAIRVVMGLANSREGYLGSINELIGLLSNTDNQELRTIIVNAYNLIKKRRGPSAEQLIISDIGNLQTYRDRLPADGWLPSRTSIRRIDQLSCILLKNLFGSTFMGLLYLDGMERYQDKFDAGTYKKSCIYYSEGSCIPSDLNFFNSRADLTYTATVYDNQFDRINRRYRWKYKMRYIVIILDIIAMIEDTGIFSDVDKKINL